MTANFKAQLRCPVMKVVLVVSEGLEVHRERILDV